MKICPYCRKRLRNVYGKNVYKGNLFCRSCSRCGVIWRDGLIDGIRIRKDNGMYGMIAKGCLLIK